MNKTQEPLKSVAQQRFRPFDVDGEIVVDEEDGDLTAVAFRPGSQQQQLIHHASAPQAHPDEAS